MEAYTIRSNDSRFSLVNWIIANVLKMCEVIGMILIISTIVYIVANKSITWMNIAYQAMGISFASIGAIVLIVSLTFLQDQKQKIRELEKASKDIDHNKKMSELGLEKLSIERMKGKGNPAPKRVDHGSEYAAGDQEATEGEVMNWLRETWEEDKTLQTWTKLSVDAHVKKYKKCRLWVLNKLKAVENKSYVQAYEDGARNSSDMMSFAIERVRNKNS